MSGRGNRSPSGRYWNWDDLTARARAVPNRFQLLLPDAPRSVVKTINLRRAAALVLDDGTLEAYAENEYTDQDGIRKANVYVRFVSVTVTDQDTHP